MARTAALPILTAENGLTRYLEEIRRFPMLEPQEEYMLAKSWREHGDRTAAHRLVTSHLRLVAKIAMGYRGYGLPISEVISEGNVGLMQAVKRFEPEKGFRLATYAMWWIKASIQEYILRSWSLVKMGTTANQKKLFFNLRKAKSKISALDEGDLRPDQVKLIAKRLGVTEQDVIDMNRRLGGDASLNAPIREDGDSGEWQDSLVGDRANHEEPLRRGAEIANPPPGPLAGRPGEPISSTGLTNCRPLMEAERRNCAYAFCHALMVMTLLGMVTTLFALSKIATLYDPVGVAAGTVTLTVTVLSLGSPTRSAG